jgi:hypothetical protein
LDQIILTVGLQQETPLNINLEINSERHDSNWFSARGVICGGDEQRKLMWGNMVDELHVPV